MADLAKREDLIAPPTALELRPETVKAYRNELRRARVHASLPRQDELAKIAIDTCIDILSNREARCMCATEEVSGKLAHKKGTRINALCQSCKRAHWALTMVIDLEKLIVDRIKIDAGLLKLSAERISGVNDLGSAASLNTVEIIRAYHREAQQASAASVVPIMECDNSPAEEELPADEPPSRPFAAIA